MKAFDGFKSEKSSGGSFGLSGSLGATSGQSQNHDQSQEKRSQFLHFVFLQLILY